MTRYCIIRTSLGIFEVRNIEDITTLLAILFRGTYDCLTIQDTDVVLDAGANIGIFTCYAAKRAQKVISVEPNSENYQLLKRNLELNNIDNVIPICCALSDYNGSGLFTGEGLSGSLLENCMNKNANQVTVNVETVDSLLSKLKIPFVSVVKMDIEGSETKVLSLNTLFLNKVREIVVETHSENATRVVKKTLMIKNFEVRNISSARKLYYQIKKTNKMAEYVVLNKRTGLPDIQMYLNFLLVKLGLKWLSTTLNFGLIYGKKRKRHHF